MPPSADWWESRAIRLHGCAAAKSGGLTSYSSAHCSRARVAVEAESRVTAVQALLRRLELKRRDGDVDRLLLVLNDTAHNRRLTTTAVEPLRAQFPGSARTALRMLALGSMPSSDTILLL